MRSSASRCEAWIHCEHPAVTHIHVRGKRLYVCASCAADVAKLESYVAVYKVGKRELVIIHGTCGPREFTDNTAIWRSRRW